MKLQVWFFVHATANHASHPSWSVHTVSAVIRFMREISQTGGPPNGVLTGDRAVAAHSILRIKYPVEQRYIADIDGLMRLLWYAFEELRAEPSEQGLVVVLPRLTPTATVEAITQAAFEQLNVPSLFAVVTPEAALAGAMASAGPHTGLVVDVGETASDACAVLQGQLHKESLRRPCCGMRSAQQELMAALSRSGHSLTGTADLTVARELLEAAAVAGDNSGAVPEEVPTVSVQAASHARGALKLGRERLEAMGVFFGGEGGGLPGHALAVAEAVPGEDLLSAVVLVGGGASVSGMGPRLQAALGSSAKVLTPPKPSEAAWRGAVLLGRTAEAGLWATANDYEEVGPCVAARWTSVTPSASGADNK